MKHGAVGVLGARPQTGGRYEAEELIDRLAPTRDSSVSAVLINLAGDRAEVVVVLDAGAELDAGVEVVACIAAGVGFAESTGGSGAC